MDKILVQWDKSLPELFYNVTSKKYHVSQSQVEKQPEFIKHLEKSKAKIRLPLLNYGCISTKYGYSFMNNVENEEATSAIVEFDNGIQILLSADALNIAL